MQRISVIDSHTEGEPTRVVVAGGPDLGAGSPADRLKVFRERFDWFRSAVVNEPRGHDAVVGALVLPPTDPAALCGVIFFNNVGFLNGCGHGTIGLAVTMAHLGKAGPGRHTVQTPVGNVEFELGEGGAVTIQNVPSRRARKAVGVDVPGIGRVTGDIAWGGNWFYLIESHGLVLHLSNLDRLTEYTWRVRKALTAAGITGDDGGEIDHIELFGPPGDAKNHSRNFVLCPGKAYDRSPCGTGTSAKLACLVADGKLAERDVWRQESIIGSVFEGRVRRRGADIIPSITGRAFVTAESTLIIADADPFRHGIR